MNGWTALHWAAKRNHSVVVAYLITSGSDENLADFSGRLPGDVTDDPEVRSLLKVSETQPPAPRNSSLPFTPNYIRNPVVHKDDYYIPEPDSSRGGGGSGQAVNRRLSDNRRFHDVSTSPATSAAGSPMLLNNMSANRLDSSLSNLVPNEPSQSTPNSAHRTNPTKILKLKASYLQSYKMALFQAFFLCVFEKLKVK